MRHLLKLKYDLGTPEWAYFSFNKCPILASDGANAKYKVKQRDMGTAVDRTAYLKNQLNQIHQLLSTYPNSTDVFLCNPKDLKQCKTSSAKDKIANANPARLRSQKVKIPRILCERGRGFSDGRLVLEV